MNELVNALAAAFGLKLLRDLLLDCEEIFQSVEAKISNRKFV